MMLEAKFANIHFTGGRPAPVKWPARVAAYLANHPGDPALDLALVEAACAGRVLRVTEASQARQALLMDAARDHTGKFSLDGRAALLAAVRARFTAGCEA